MSAFLGRESLMPTGMKRKRSRQRPAGDAAADTLSSSDSEDEVMSSPAPEVKKKKGEKTPQAGAGDASSTTPKGDQVPGPDGWTQAEVNTLIQTLSERVPSEDNLKYTTQATRMDWDNISVADHSGEECKEKWNIITTKLRRFRTMTEMLHDAKEWAKQPWNSYGKKPTKHPEMPKKPLTPFFRFFLEKRQKYCEIHPGLSMTDVSKMLAEKFKGISEKKKQKYVDSYNKESEEYKIAIKKFKEEHPELFTDEKVKEDTGAGASADGKDAPPKTTSPMLLYLQAKTDEYIKKNPTATRKDCHEMFKYRWNELPDNKKLKYINKAVAAKVEYDAQMEEYCSRHPNYRPKVLRTFVSKVEQKIKDKHDGKPDKPPPNGYGLFASYVLPTLKDLPANERMGEVSRLWKGLEQSERDSYNNKATEKMQEYKDAYQKYLDNLPPEELKRLQEAEKKKKLQDSEKAKALKATQAVAAQRPNKPVSAMFLFMNDKKEKYAKKFPSLNQQELTRHMVKEFNSLPAEKKEKYKKMENEQKAQMAQYQRALKHQENDPEPNLLQELIQATLPSAKETPRAAPTTTPKASSHKREEHAETKSRPTAKAKNVHFPGEPKKPPGSGYALFSTEMLVKLKDVKTQQRMTVLSQKWNAMTDKEKQEYKKRRDAIHQKYIKDLAKFKANLSAKDRKRYEELEAQRKRPSKARGKKAAPPPVDKEEEKEESESEAESEAEQGQASESESSSAASESESESEEEDNRAASIPNGITSKAPRKSLPPPRAQNSSIYQSDSESSSGSSSASSTASTASSESDVESDTSE